MAPSEESVLKMLQQNLNDREKGLLNPLATLSTQSIRRKPESYEDTAYRQSFSLDVDRILHSNAYTRYIDKTQVFYLIQNDHISHRVLHVQLVSKIARTIGRFLGLNEDLIEAIALGHDIGHTPFGHDGEHFLSELCHAHGIGNFLHNVQSIQFLERVERKGKGWNLSLQTLDGILCHDGEIHNETLKPQPGKNFSILDTEMKTKQAQPDTRLIPMTLEGCVVRIADTISYIGRDIEDAIRLDMIHRSDLPRESVSVLGDTNGTIVFNLVSDIIQNSYQKPHVAFSPDVSEALKRLKSFNLERIYLNRSIKMHTPTIKTMFGILFERYLNDLKHPNRSSVIFSNFLKDISDEYLECHSHEKIVRDFIAGMTDRYFLKQFPDDMRPNIRSMP